MIYYILQSLTELMAGSAPSCQMSAAVFMDPGQGCHRVHPRATSRKTITVLHCKQVKKILEEGSLEPDCHNQYGVTAMHLAAMQDAPVLVGLLATNGGNVDYQSIDGNTPLHLCCQDGCDQAAAMLLRCGLSSTATGTRTEK